MRRIAVFLQLLFYSFIFVPDTHSVTPLPVMETDNIIRGAASIYTVFYLVGLIGLFCVLFYLNHDRAFIINLFSSLLLIIPIFHYASWHNFWIPCLTAIPFMLMTVSSVLQLRLS